jgi:tight adherence protein B
VRRLGLLALLLVAACLAAGAATASPGLRLRVAKGPAFPVRTFALSLAKARPLTAGTVHVTENGGPVADLRVTPTGTSHHATSARKYELRYKSLLGPSVKVQVEVHVPAVGSAKARYKTPTLSIPAPPKPYSPSLWSRILGSSLTMLVLALLCGVGVAVLLTAVLAPRSSGLPARMAEFVSIPGLRQDGKRPRSESDASPERKGRWARFEEMVEIADISAAPRTIVAVTAVGTVLVFLLIYVVTGSFWWALLALLVPVGTRQWVVRTLARRRNRFAEQLPDALQVISSALRSGHSFAGALAVVVESASEPMKSEMHRVVADEQRGVPLETSIAVVAERMQNADLEQLGLVAELQREAGGNAAEVVDRVAETVRERFELRRLVKTLTTQGRMSGWIVTALPIVIVVLLEIINPHYLHPMLESLAGTVALVLAALWCVAGSFVIRKIVDIKV